MDGRTLPPGEPGYTSAAPRDERRMARARVRFSRPPPTPTPADPSRRPAENPAERGGPTPMTSSEDEAGRWLFPPGPAPKKSKPKPKLLRNPPLSMGVPMVEGRELVAIEEGRELPSGFSDEAIDDGRELGAYDDGRELSP